MSATLIASATPSDTYDVGLYDLDGVIYLGDAPVEHAVEAVPAAAARGLRPLYVTNNSSREPEEIAAQISGFGVECTPEQIITSAQSVAILLADVVEPGARVLVVGGAGLRTAVRQAGFTVVESADDAPAAVVQGFAPHVSWRELAQAAYAIGDGARHVATNLDGSIPKERGIAPGNGALVGAVVRATGVEPIASGKPLPAIYHQAAERLSASTPLAIGDRLDTDLEGARAAGMPGLLVLTGVASARDVVLAPPSQRPSLLAIDLRGLFEPHPGPEPGRDGWWRCGTARARVVDGAIELAEQDHSRRLVAEKNHTLTLDGWRAVCVAAWAQADGGHPLQPQDVPHLSVT